MDYSSRLFRAVAQNDGRLVRTCLAECLDPNVQNELLRTPLHEAVLSHSLEAARALLDHGAAVNAVDRDGQTPLHYAGRCGGSEACRLLLSHGAEILLEDADGITPLRTAALHQNWEVLTVLEEEFRRSQIMRASRLAGKPVRSRSMAPR